MTMANPPLPQGTRYPRGSEHVTPAMTALAVAWRNAHAPGVFAVSEPQLVDGVLVRARTAWHDYQASTGKSGTFWAGEILFVDGPAPAAAPPTVLRGVDVSAFQPHVNWIDVAGGGYAYAWIKATEGLTWSSAYYPAQYAGAGAVGLLRGAYHFFRSTSPPVAQVRRFVETVRAIGETEMPLSLDIEWQRKDDPLGGLDAATFADNVSKATSELAQLTGRRPVIYSAPGFWNLLPHGQRVAIAGEADLWIAAYRATPPPPLDGWARWVFWQASDREAIPGIGPCDANRFMGALDELRAWAGGGEHAPATAPWALEDAARLFNVAVEVDAGLEGLAALERRWRGDLAA